MQETAETLAPPVADIGLMPWSWWFLARQEVHNKSCELHDKTDATEDLIPKYKVVLSCFPYERGTLTTLTVLSLITIPDTGILQAIALSERNAHSGHSSLEVAQETL